MRRSVWLRLLVLALAVTLIGGACTRGGGEEETDGGTNAENEENQETGQSGGGNDDTLLTEIRDRGTLRCGVNNEVPGFGFQDPDTNEIDGFDIDFCRAFTAAIFGDPEQHELVPVTSDDRFIALRGGDYDVLVRNTTATSSRDGTEGLAFAHPNFYDGQAMMVKADEFSSIEEMDGASVCVTTGTTTELNLADYFQDLGMDFEPVAFEENPQIQEAFIRGRCQGWTSDRSQLAGLRSQFPQSEGGPESLIILEDVMSKEPLAPAVLDGDSQWLDVVNWTVQGLILAEELGVTQDNVDKQIENPDNPGVAALLGVPFEDGEAIDYGLAVDNTFMQDVIRAVGNYGEIFDRHLGPNSPLELERGINALWTEGGIQYALPFR